MSGHARIFLFLFAVGLTTPAAQAATIDVTVPFLIHEKRLNEPWTAAPPVLDQILIGARVFVVSDGTAPSDLSGVAVNAGPDGTFGEANDLTFSPVVRIPDPVNGPLNNQIGPFILADTDTLTQPWQLTFTGDMNYVTIDLPALTDKLPNAETAPADFPDNVMGVVQSDGSIGVSWTNPTGLDVDRIRVRLRDDQGSILIEQNILDLSTASILFSSLPDAVFAQVIFENRLFDSGILFANRVSASSALTPVPLPAALPLFAGGLGLMGLLGWRRKRMAA